MREIFVESRELHFPDDNDYVCVGWNTKTKSPPPGVPGEVKVERTSNPYIDFVIIRKFQDTSMVGEDSPMAGGLMLNFAQKMHDELGRAIKYLEEVIDG